MTWTMDKTQEVNSNKKKGYKEEVTHFTQNTTLHGMSQATDQNSHPARR